MGIRGEREPEADQTAICCRLVYNSGWGSSLRVNILYVLELYGNEESLA
jgi:hypothetical protein